jgi:site-specific DNA recombinase
VKAILYCRVSSEEQTKGFSLNGQEKDGIEDARKNNIEIVKIFKVMESAAEEGREVFGEAMRYIKRYPDVEIFLVSKMDRMIRNFKDMASADELARRFNKQIRFYHEGWTYTKSSTIADFYRLGFMGVVATGFSRNLSDITKQGLRRRAEAGQIPQPAPYGYTNNKDTRVIEIDPLRAPWVIRIKELAAMGISIKNIRLRLAAEGCPDKFWDSKVARVIERTCYHGIFQWAGETWRGSYSTIISKSLHDAAVAGLKRLNKPKQQTQIVAYRGVIKCGTCSRLLTGEKHSGKNTERGKRFTYYGCRLRCQSYIEEHRIDEQFEKAFSRIHVSEEQAASILSTLEKSSGQDKALRESKIAVLKGEHTKIKTLLERAYEDKLLGKLEESDWLRRSRTWKEKALTIEEQIKVSEADHSNSALTLRRVLELLNVLKTQFRSLPPEKRGQIASWVCSNTLLVGKTLSFTYANPFDTIVEIAESIKRAADGRKSEHRAHVKDLLISNNSTISAAVAGVLKVA